jgi:transcriptional regulator with XRE-family HTH domain
MSLMAKGKPKGDRKPSGFGAKLRQLREAAKLTQEELGKRVGMDFTTIARYERGAVEPTWPNVLKLANVLGVALDDLRGESAE